MLRMRSPIQVTALFKTLRYQLFWQGLWLPYFTNFQRYRFSFEQQLDLNGLICLARSQGFVSQEGTAAGKLISELSKFHNHFADDQGRVKLIYCTHLYLATPIHN